MHSSVFMNTATGIAATGTQDHNNTYTHTQSSLPPATQAEQFAYDLSQDSSSKGRGRGRGKRTLPTHSAGSFSSEVGMPLYGSLITYTHIVLFVKSSIHIQLYEYYYLQHTNI